MTSRARAARQSLPILPTGTAAVATPPQRLSPGPGPKIGLITLGCDKNTVDSERVLATLAGAGARLSPELEDADVVLVNTCGFIDLAREESVDTLLDAVRLKQDGRVRAVVALGCLVQRHKDELQQELPEVDLFLGLTEMDRLIPELHARGLIPGAADAVPAMERPLRLLSTSTPHTSYLKISEGCDHTCAFCAIPLMRGKHRSAPVEQLVREALELQARGVVELNIVSQDTTWYGRDLLRGGAAVAGDLFAGRPFDGMAGPRGGALTVPAVTAPAEPAAGANRRGLLPDLLEALLRGTDIPWFRLFYMYPSGIQPELVELLAREPRLLPYLDMPIQHGSDRVLRLMRRPERQATIRERVGWLRSAVPELVLRTTVIVGFPGETDEDFESLLELLEEIRFDRLGAFSYSPEEATPAVTLPDQVPDALRRERLERLLDVQRGISLERNESRLGRTETVLVDSVGGAAGFTAVGRSRGQALEVDGVIHLRGGSGLRPGAFARVRIVEAAEDDLVGEVLAEV
jgi:ribosomal protein S12 methylthiotransferase